MNISFLAKKLPYSQICGTKVGTFYKKRRQSVSVGTIIHIFCEDINDNYPIVTLSPAPYPGVVCQQLERNFNDTKFLNDHGIANVSLDRDGKDGYESELQNIFFVNYLIGITNNDNSVSFKNVNCLIGITNTEN